MRTNARHLLLHSFSVALALAASATNGVTLPLPAMSVAAADDPQLLRVQDICGTIGNCGIGMGGIDMLPKQTITPDIGRFDPGHDNRFGRYRYAPPDLQLNLDVPTTRGNARVTTPRYTGTRTLYKVGKLSAEHVDWCYERYRSYRAKDNSYQPDKGPRKVCNSPFD